MVMPNSLQWISVPYFVVSGLFLITGVFYALFSAYLPRGPIGRKGYLWFGLTCIFLALYSLTSAITFSSLEIIGFSFWVNLQFILAIPLIVFFIQFSAFHLGFDNTYFRWIFPLLSFSFWILFFFPGLMLREEMFLIPLSVGGLTLWEPRAPLAEGGVAFLVWGGLNSLIVAYFWLRHFFEKRGDVGLLISFFLFILAGFYDTGVSLGFFQGPFIFVFGFSGLLIAVALQLFRAGLRVNQNLQYKTKQLEVANEELRFLVGTISHDIMSPLVSIHGFTDLLQGGKPFKDGQRDRFLDRIRANADHMKNLLEDLADYVRVGRVEEEFETVDLKNVIHQALAMLDLPSQYPKGVVEIIKNWPPYCGSPKRLKQIIINLVQNSFKYAQRDDVRVSIWGKNFEKGIQLCVEDNGPGIPEFLREKVFETFFRGTTETHGTGMGLAIVRKIAENYGGRVWLDPDFKAGTCVCVYLPSMAPGEPSP